MFFFNFAKPQQRWPKYKFSSSEDFVHCRETRKLLRTTFKMRCNCAEQKAYLKLHFCYTQAYIKNLGESVEQGCFWSISILKIACTLHGRSSDTTCNYTSVHPTLFKKTSEGQWTWGCSSLLYASTSAYNGSRMGHSRGFLLGPWATVLTMVT